MCGISGDVFSRHVRTSVFVQAYVCMFAYNLGTGGVILQVFRVPQEWFYMQKFVHVWGKNLGRGSWVEVRIGIFLFSRDFAGHVPQQADWALRWHWTGCRHTHRGRQTVRIAQMKLIETGVGADTLVHDTGARTTHIYGKWGPWVGEVHSGAAYIMPNWANRMASRVIKLCIH